MEGTPPVSQVYRSSVEAIELKPTTNWPTWSCCFASPNIALLLTIGLRDISNEETAFEVTSDHCGVSTASSIGIIRAYYACVSGRSYLHQLYLSKMIAIKCKFLNAAFDLRF